MSVGKKLSQFELCHLFLCMVQNIKGLAKSLNLQPRNRPDLWLLLTHLTPWIQPDTTNSHNVTMASLWFTMCHLIRQKIMCFHVFYAFWNSQSSVTEFWLVFFLQNVKPAIERRTAHRNMLPHLACLSREPSSACSSLAAWNLCKKYIMHLMKMKIRLFKGKFKSRYNTH